MLLGVSKKRTFRDFRESVMPPPLLAAEPLPRQCKGNLWKCALGEEKKKKKRNGGDGKGRKTFASLSLSLSHHQKTTAALLLLRLLTLSGLIGDLDKHLLGLVLLYESENWSGQRREER